MAFGIDGAGEKMFTGQIDHALRIRQESVVADRADFAVDDGDAAFDDARGRDDQTIFKNNVGGVFSHKLLVVLHAIARPE